MSKKCTPLWCEAHFEVKMYKTLGDRTTFGGSDVAPLRFGSLHYTIHSTTLQYITLHYTPQHYNYNYRTTQLHSTTHRYTKLHYTTLHYTRKIDRQIDTQKIDRQVGRQSEKERQRMREIKHLSVHQWLRSAIPDSQQPSSPIGFLFLKLRPPPCAVLLVSSNESNGFSCIEFNLYMVNLCFFSYPLVDIQKAIENGHRKSGFIH